MADLLETLAFWFAYEPETGVFRWLQRPHARSAKRAGDIAGSTCGSGRNAYTHLRIGSRHWPAHRIAWLFTYGTLPIQFIDHINGDRRDNRIQNLREADARLNQHNKRQPSKRSKSGYLGVSKHGPSWRFQIRADGVDYSKGRFKTPEAAYEAYVEAKRVLHADGCTL